MRGAPRIGLASTSFAFAFACAGCGSSVDRPPSVSNDPCDTVDAADPRAIDVGRCAVVHRSCGNCHDSGDGTLAGRTNPRLGTTAYPANLTPDPETGLGTWTNDQIVRAFRTGVDKDGHALCFVMPRFEIVGDDEAYAIAHYLKSLAPVHHVVPTSVCPPVKPADAGNPDSDSDASDADADVDAADADPIDGDAAP